jgi:hypothetical protein
MNLDDLIANFKDEPTWKFEQKLNELIRTNSKFFNLRDGNKKIILNFIKKYADNIRLGRGIPDYSLREESYHLYQQRVKLGLSDNDLEDIKEILRLFKK